MEQLVNQIKKIIGKQNSDKTDLKQRFQIGELLSENMLKRGEINKLSKKIEVYGGTTLYNMKRFYEVFKNYSALFEIAKTKEWSTLETVVKKDSKIEELSYYLNLKEDDKTIRQKIEGDYFNKTFLPEIENDNYKFELQRISIKNFKSLVDVVIDKPTHFKVFAGSNASGKSSIFEAIEFLLYSLQVPNKTLWEFFGGKESVINFNAQDRKQIDFEVKIELTNGVAFWVRYDGEKVTHSISPSEKFKQRFIDSFSRIFIDKHKRAVNKLKVPDKLWLDAENVSRILYEILKTEDIKQDINTWLSTFIPDFKNIEIKKDPFNGEYQLNIYENSYIRPFTGHLISDGTMAVISLLAIFYQSDNQQFICIEEPENGLNPKVLKEMLEFFKRINEKNGIYIWISTHSPFLVSLLTMPDELVTVQKEKGNTLIYQCKEGDFDSEMKADEAWLSNFLKNNDMRRGGIPW